MVKDNNGKVVEPEGKEPGVQKVITIIRAEGEPDKVTVTHSSGTPEPAKMMLAPDPTINEGRRKRRQGRRKGLRQGQRMAQPKMMR